MAFSQRNQSKGFIYLYHVVSGSGDENKDDVAICTAGVFTKYGAAEYHQTHY